MSVSANDPSLRSWVNVPTASDFPVQNLPYGIFKRNNMPPHAGVAIGAHVLDLAVLQRKGLLVGLPKGVFETGSLNAFMALGRPTWGAVRQRISELLRHDCPTLRDDAATVAEALIPQVGVDMLLPMEVGDYTDFYASREHATNVGTMFRGKENALMPNWLHIPIGYHGRASSIVASGTPIRRPKGQYMPQGASAPEFGPTRQLDIELEVAFVVGTGNALGDSISVDDAEQHIFGLMLFNDWSARDIQSWEYQPLGPFLGKNFGSTVSPWVVTLDALEPFRTQGPVQDTPVLPYLRNDRPSAFDIALEVGLRPEGGTETVICRSNFSYMYWSMAQMLAHHTVNGCNMRTGDVCASGTISGSTEDSYGSMLELTWRGTRPLQLPDGTERKFLLDGDTVTIRGHAAQNGVRIGFGECVGKILPAR
jgi:fumarylacetoacetase